MWVLLLRRNKEIIIVIFIMCLHKIHCSFLSDVRLKNPYAVLYSTGRCRPTNPFLLYNEPWSRSLIYLHQAWKLEQSVFTFPVFLQSIQPSSWSVYVFKFPPASLIPLFLCNKPEGWFCSSKYPLLGIGLTVISKLQHCFQLYFSLDTYDCVAPNKILPSWYKHIIH